MKFHPDVEKYRVTAGPMGSALGEPGGLFKIPRKNVMLTVLAGSAMPEESVNGQRLDWDHVSVSLPNRCPNWEEMACIKNFFFDEEETAVQFHPKKSEHVNHHPHCLHLWKKHGVEFELPPTIMV
jgi:hypothetical protein